MRVAILGGTRFIGPAIVEEAVAHGHQPLLIHRGRHEIDDGPDVPHLHCDRRDVSALRAALEQAAPDALVDTCAFTRDAVATLFAAQSDPAVRRVVLSSMDVYRAFGTVLGGGPATDAVPLNETSAVRGPEARFIHSAHPPRPQSDADPATYEKLEVEPLALSHGAAVLRLPMVYGERDPMQREGFVLRRLRAGRVRIPFGTGTFLWTRGYVRDVATAVRLSIERDEAAGELFNVGEARTASIAQWAEQIAAAAGQRMELVRVPDALLPDDLSITGAIAQHLLVSSDKARRVLGFRETDPHEALRRSVEWHLAQPPTETPPDFSADDRALAAAERPSRHGA